MATTTKPRQVTYLGRRAITWEVRDAGAHGRRDVYIHHIDDADERNGGFAAGTTTVQTNTGNFLKGTGQVLVERHVVEGVTIPTTTKVK